MADSFNSFLPDKPKKQRCARGDRVAYAGAGSRHARTRVCIPASIPIGPISAAPVSYSAPASTRATVRATTTPGGSAVLGINEHPEGAWRGSGVPVFDSNNYLRVLDAMQAAGSKLVRIPVLGQLLQPASAASYNQGYLGKLDAFIAAANTRGMKVLITLAGTPCWTTTAPNLGCSTTAYATSAGPLYPPKSMTSYQAAAQFVVNRWGQGLAGLEVWNEPNYDKYFRVPAGHDVAKDYVALVRAAYAGAKSADPAIPVIAGALAESDGVFLARLYAQGLAGSADAISVHPYNMNWNQQGSLWGDPLQPFSDTTSSLATGVPWLHDLMTLNGEGSKPIWVTEVGYSDCNASPTCLDRTTAADYMTKSLSLLQGMPYVSHILVHEAWDANSNREVWSGFGLLANDYTKKPAYCAFANAAGVSSCAPDDPDDEIAAQDDLTRAWLLLRARAMTLGGFSALTPAAVRQVDSDLRGFSLTSKNGVPSVVADSRRIGLWTSASPLSFEICNATATKARCMRDTLSSGSEVLLHGSDSSGTFGAAGVTNNKTSSTW